MGIVVFDIDGTLSIVGDRLKYLNQEKKDWDKFYSLAGEDKINTNIAGLYKLLFKCTAEIPVVITGRREGIRDITLKWLEDNNLPMSSSHLLMRKDGDYRSDAIIKAELAAPFMNKITMVFEDRQQVVDMWRSKGITCLQVADGNF